MLNEEKTMPETALVTGADGFIGSHLAEALLRAGRRVRALVWYNARASWGWLEEARRRGEPNLEVVLGDVTDPYQMMQVVEDCDTVFHLAALIGIPYSYQAPASYVNTNVLGTLHLAQAARKHSVRRFIHTSTSEVYGTARYVPMNEEHPLQGQSPYSASKIGADKVVESFHRSFGLPAVTVRPFNTYGPRQSARAVIPTIIAQALRGPEVRLGSLDPVRDLTYVSDTAAGFIAAAEADAAVGRVINLGTGEGVSIGQLAQMVLEVIGGEHRIVHEESRVRPADSEVMRLISDNRLAREILGWRPLTPLREGLQRTVEWVRRNADTYLSTEYQV
jgi:dTDP-glucose 4,6-dehydratase